MELDSLTTPEKEKAPVPNSRFDLNHPRVTLLIDTATPSVNAVHVPGMDLPPFLFLSVSGSLDLWSHDAAAFRRLADACLHAADSLERANITWGYAPTAEPVLLADGGGPS